MARHGGGEVLLGDGGGGVLLGDVDGFGQRFFFASFELCIRRAGVTLVVLLFLDAKDIGRALNAGEQVLAVVGVKEFAKRLDAADDQQQIVLALKREYRVDQIVSRAPARAIAL